MTTLLLHTNASITSLRAPSVLSLSTTNPSDTDTTVSEGIGTASGRAIYAVGAAALKGIETFAIRRRLRIINAFFPHGNDVFAPNIEVIYHDTLELSRYDLLTLCDFEIYNNNNNIQTRPVSCTSAKADPTSADDSNRKTPNTPSSPIPGQMAFHRNRTLSFRHPYLPASRMVRR